MYVLGIDPGLSSMGYAILETGSRRPRAIAAGAVRTSPQDPIEKRLLELHTDLTEIIREYEPAEVAVEQVFVNNNLQTATAVGRASGAIILSAAQAGLRVFEYTPSAIKLAVCGVGNADKAQVQAVIAMRLGLDAAPKPADAADALAIALCHFQSSGLRRAVEASR